MKGRAQPTYTPTKHRWLRTLADFPGSVRVGKGSPAFACMALGWTAWETPALPHGEVLTDLGRQVLRDWEATYPVPAPLVDERAAKVARQLGAAGLDALADWLLATGQVDGLLARLAARGAAYAAGAGAVPRLGETGPDPQVLAGLNLERTPLCHLDDGEPVALPAVLGARL